MDQKEFKFREYDGSVGYKKMLCSMYLREDWMNILAGIATDIKKRR